jgi:hypothetical protein
MELHRLTPTSISNAKSRYAGRCAACDQRLGYQDQVVHLYGEAFHYDCAFYRQSHGRAGRERRAQSA